MASDTFELMLSRRGLWTVIFCAVSCFDFQVSEATSSFEQARHFYEQRQWDNAEVAASKALAADPRMGDAEVLLGLIATMRAQFVEAEKHFLRAVALQPQNYRTQAYLGSTYLQRKRLPEAAATFRKVLELNPGNLTATYNLGVIALAQDSPSLALVYFGKVVRTNHSDVPALIGSLESQLLLGHTLEARRTAQELEKLLEDRDPRLFQAASLLAQHGESAAAIPVMERVRRAYPESYDVNYNLALACLQTAQVDRAAALLRPFTGPQGKAEAFDLLGAIEEKRGHSEAAENAFQEAARRDAGNEDYRFDYGNSLLQHAKLQPAVVAFGSAVSDLPSSGKLRVGLGSVCYLSGDYVSAVQELLEAVRLKPDSMTAYFLLGEAYDSAERFQPAIEASLKSYLKTRPRDPWAYYHYGVIRYGRAQAEGRNEDASASDDLREALRLNPNLAEAHLELGIIAMSQGKMEQAIAALEKAASLDPSLAPVHYRLGLAYQKIGNEARAKAERDQFRSLKNQERYRSRVVESLAAMGR
jgi:tetratricopeptide (TPR) repeat protein